MGVAARVADRADVRSLRTRHWGGSTHASPVLWSGAVGSVVVTAVLATALVVTAVIDPVVAPAAAAVAMLVPAAAVDLRERRLPDAWIIAAGVTLVAATWTAWMLGQSVDAVGMLVGTLAFAGPLLVLHLISPTSMGFGDVKAGLVLGAALGAVDWRLALLALTAAAGLAALIGAVRRATTIAFGPFLVIGATLALVTHERWLAALSNGSP